MLKFRQTAVAWAVLAGVMGLHVAAAEGTGVDWVIPRPAQVEQQDGVFVLGANAVIVADRGAPSILGVAEGLAQRLGRPTGYAIAVVDPGAVAAGVPVLALVLDASAGEELGREGYRLVVETGRVEIVAGRVPGLFYGVQTLLQLMPPAVESAEVVGGVAWEMPCVAITDRPRFGWRGLMLDVSRHFFTTEQVKQFIDEMARFKFNTLQLHLTDDHGWRLDIPAFPKLAAVGAWRVPREGTFGTLPAARPGEEATEGGYYTREDIREIVAYARERFITVVPEIDVPGHCLAALAAYPEFGCEGKPVAVSAGDDFRGHVPNVLCVTSARVDAWMEAVLDEVVELFPSPYIHIGGDEVDVKFWEDCKRCGAVPFRQVLTNFVNRVAGMVEQRGRTAVAWDDVMVGDVHTNIVIMNWHEIKFGADAIRRGHPVVIASRPFYYLDLYQGDPVVETPSYGGMRMRDCYRFNPQPPDTAADHTLGGQGNLWTEEIAHYRQAQYMLWPRALAIAEGVWSPAGDRDWRAFLPRLENQFARFDHANIKYATTIYEPIAWLNYLDHKLLLSLDAEVEDVEFHYSFEGEHPDSYYPRYQEPVPVPVGASEVRVAGYRDGKPVGRQHNFPIKTLIQRAVGRAGQDRFGLPRQDWRVVSVSSEQGASYGGQQALDGDPNSFWHTSWEGGDQGAPGHPHQVTVDMGEVTEASAFFCLPRQDGKRDDSMIEGFRFEVSRDGEVWLEAVTGAWQDVAAYPIIREHRFEAPLHFRFFRLTSLSAMGGKPYAGAAEIGLMR